MHSQIAYQLEPALQIAEVIQVALPLCGSLCKFAVKAHRVSALIFWRWRGIKEKFIHASHSNYGPQGLQYVKTRLAFINPPWIHLSIAAFFWMQYVKLLKRMC